MQLVLAASSMSHECSLYLQQVCILQSCEDSASLEILEKHVLAEYQGHRVRAFQPQVSSVVARPTNPRAEFNHLSVDNHSNSFYEAVTLWLADVN